MTLLGVNRPPATIGGRSLGVAILTGLQALIGVIHVFSGLLLLSYEDFSALPATAAYDVYTLVFGVLVLVLAYGIWLGKKVGWWGATAVSVFVIIADSSAVLDAPLVLGTPKAPAAVEIGYSVILMAYLLYARKKFH